MRRLRLPRLHGLPRTRTFNAVIALGAVATLVVVTAALVGVAAPDSAQPLAAASQQQSTSIKSNPSVLFVGDSYTSGPSSMEEFGYPCVAATILGWDCNLGAQPGTGYISGGDGHRLAKVLGALEQPSTSLSERFLRLRGVDRADIVVLDAGRNDLQYGPEYLRNAFVYTLRRAKESWPNSRLVVIGPWFVDRPVVEVPGGNGLTFGQYLEDTLRSFPEFNDVTFIDPGKLGWFADTDPAPYMSSDGVHPNIAGHKKIGELLAKALAGVESAGAG